jgi:hypothetical protein
MFTGTVQVGFPLAGSVVATAFPVLSTATQNDVSEHETPVR